MQLCALQIVSVGARFAITPTCPGPGCKLNNEHLP